MSSRRDRGLCGVSSCSLLPRARGQWPSTPRGPGVEAQIGLLCTAVRAPPPRLATVSLLSFRLPAVDCGPRGLNGNFRNKRFVRFESCGSVTKSHTVLLCPAQEAHRPLVRCLRSRPAVGDQVTVTVSQCSCVSRPGYTQQWPKAICMASTTVCRRHCSILVLLSLTSCCD